MSINYNNLGLDMSDKKSSIVAKRKASILKKRENKEKSKAKYHAKREDKYILAAGDAYHEDIKETKKKEKLNVWIMSEQPKMTKGYELRGVILAPNVNQKSEKGIVSIICGEDAIHLLGGLQQVFEGVEY